MPLGTRPWRGQLTVKGAMPEGVLIVGDYGQILGGAVVDRCSPLGTEVDWPGEKIDAPHVIVGAGWVIEDLTADPQRLLQVGDAEAIAVPASVVSAVQMTVERIAAEATRATKTEADRRLGTQDAIRAMMQEIMHGGHVKTTR